jgi:hypothetical protein
MSDATNEEVLEAYRTYRIMDQVVYYTRQAERYERARRRALALTSLLFVLATLFGALGAVDETHRGLWAFMAAGLAALATAVTGYESAFSFEVLARQYRDTVAALKLTEAQGPAPTDPSPIEYINGIELILRSEVETWSRLSVDLTSLAGSKPPEEPKPETPPSRRR